MSRFISHAYMNVSSAMPPGIDAGELNPELRKDVNRIEPFQVRDGRAILPYRSITLRGFDRSYLVSLLNELFPTTYADAFYDRVISGVMSSIGLEYATQPPPSPSLFSKIYSNVSYGLDMALRPPEAETERYAGGIVCGLGIFTDKMSNPQDIKQIIFHLLSERLGSCRTEFLNDAIFNERYYVSPTDTMPYQLDWSMIADTMIQIVSLGTLQEFRRQGISEHIVERICEYAVRRSKKVVFLHCIEYNAAALSLYTKLGFKEVQRISEYYVLANSRRMYDGILLCKELVESENQDFDTTVTQLLRMYKRSCAAYTF